MEWNHAKSPKAKKCRSQLSAEKVLVTVFFDYQGVLLSDFKEPGVNINAELYADSLKRLGVSIKNEHPGQLTNGVAVLNDNARPHVPQTIQDLLSRIKWEVLQHPPYSPDMSPCDYHVFGPLKKITKRTAVQIGVCC